MLPLWLGTLALSLTGYANLAHQLLDMAQELCGGRIVFSLEGGYELGVLSLGVLNTFYALLYEDQVVDPYGPFPGAEIDASSRIRQVLDAHDI
jgi:acetoin utilization deacetylase AcuC-like enzyme